MPPIILPAPIMPDKFDPYREALVMETETEWPEELADAHAPQRRLFSDFLAAAGAFGS